MPLLLGVIAVETAIAAYILFGDSRVSWYSATVTFSIFTIAAIYAILTGRNCNCISNIIPPQYMLVSDVAILVFLIFNYPHRDAGPIQAVREGWMMAISLTMGSVVAGLAANQWQTVDRSNPLEFLLADESIGKRWPLNSRFHSDLKLLDSGNWLVVVVRRDCNHCQELVSTTFADPARTRSGERTAVFLAGDDRWSFRFDHVSMDFETTTAIQWLGGAPFVASPAVFVLEDGFISKAADGLATDGFLSDVFAEWSE